MLKLGLAVLALGAVALLARFLPLGDWTLRAVEMVRDTGATGAAVYFGIYVAAVILMVPGSALTIGAGFAWGFAGVALVWPAATTAAIVSFWLGRTVARGWVARKVAASPRFRAVDEAVGEDGFKFVLLFRLSPLFPFGFLNLVLGLSRVRARDYVLATVSGILPGTFLYIYVGTLVTNAAALAEGERPEAGVWGRVAFWGGLVATVLVTTLITRAARKKLREALPVE